jgi:hypothetical protein
MHEYEFTVWLNREVTDAEVELLYEAGLDDAGIETGPQGALLDVTRAAATPEEAVESVRRDVGKVPGLEMVKVGLVVQREP